MVLSTVNHLLKPEPKLVDHNLITIIERGFVPPDNITRNRNRNRSNNS